MITAVRPDKDGEPRLALLLDTGEHLAWMTFDAARELRDSLNDSLLEWADKHQVWEEARIAGRMKR